MLVVEARYYDEIQDQLLTGARAVLDAAGLPHRSADRARLHWKSRR